MYKVRGIVMQKVELTYTIFANSKKEAKLEIEDGGYIPDNEEQLDEDFKVVSVECMTDDTDKKMMKKWPNND